MSNGRLEAQITIPPGGWSGTINDSGAGGAVSWTVPAGTYYLLDLLDELSTQLNTAATTDTITVAIGNGENGTGKVSITSSGAATLTWTSTDLRDLLGYSADLTLSAGVANTAGSQARSLWIANCSYDAPNDIGDWTGWIETDGRSSESAGGAVFSIAGQYKQATWLRWPAVSRARASQANESTTNESFERFVRDGVWGLATWGTPGGPIKFYPDASGPDWVEYAVNLSQFREFKPEHFADGWAGGPWRCQFERLVVQSSGGSVGTDGPNNWYVPTSSADFVSLGLAVPDYLCLCQDSASSLAAAIDTLGVGSMTTSGAGHLYQQSVTGWTRKFVGYPGAATSWRTGNFALSAGESLAIVCYAAIDAAAGNERIFQYGASSAMRVQAAGTTGVPRAVFNGLTADGAVAHDGLTTVRQWCLYRRADTNESKLITDQETVTGTHSELSVASTYLALGTGDATASVATRCGWLAIYKGANAERDWSAYLATLRGV